MDFSSMLSRWETRRQKNRRVARETAHSARRLQTRMREIADYYTAPLKGPYTRRFYSYNPDCVGRGPFGVPSPLTRCIEVDKYGDTEAQSRLLGDRTPRLYMRMTRQSAWFQHRFHHYLGYHVDHAHDANLQRLRTLSLMDDGQLRRYVQRSLTCTYADYIRIIADAISRTKRQEAQTTGRLGPAIFPIVKRMPGDQLPDTTKKNGALVLGPGQKRDMPVPDVDNDVRRVEEPRVDTGLTIKGSLLDGYWPEFEEVEVSESDVCLSFLTSSMSSVSLVLTPSVENRAFIAACSADTLNLS